MKDTLTESALIDSALATIGVVLAHGETSAASPERVAIRCCLTSASALLDVSRTLILRSVPMSPQDEAQYWTRLVEQTKVAGRSAYGASLALTDPESRYR